MAGGGKEPELRLGLVLYGGVSLAVYIYGVVVEVQRLLQASARFEGGIGSGRRRDRVEGGYAKALSRRRAYRGTSVDIISGTSAGGINGILLAKALAEGGDVRVVVRASGSEAATSPGSCMASTTTTRPR